MTWGPQKKNWDTFTTRPEITVNPKAQQAVNRRQQVLGFMMVVEYRGL